MLLLITIPLQNSIGVSIKLTLGVWPGYNWCYLIRISPVPFTQFLSTKHPMTPPSVKLNSIHRVLVSIKMSSLLKGDPTKKPRKKIAKEKPKNKKLKE